jgi:hypothetical protein
VLDSCPQPRRRQPPGPDQRIKITGDPGFLPVQARGVGIRLRGGRLYESPPPVGAADTGGQSWAESAGCGRGLDDSGAARALDLCPHRPRDVRPVDSGSFGWWPGHVASLVLRPMTGQTILHASTLAAVGPRAWPGPKFSLQARLQQVSPRSRQPLRTAGVRASLRSRADHTVCADVAGRRVPGSGCHSMPLPAKHIQRGSAGPVRAERVSQGIRLLGVR